MALVGNISGSYQNDSIISLSGSAIFADTSVAASFPNLPGNDVNFYVSGTIDGRNTSNRGVAAFGGDTIVSGTLYSDGGLKSTTVSGSGDFNVGGELRVAGDLRLDGNDIKSSTGAVALSFTGSNVVVNGNLSVNGTTTTINTQNLEIKDAIIGLAFASGSTGPEAQTVGDRAIIFGLGGESNTALLWDESNNEFAACRTDDTPRTVGDVTPVAYSQLHVSTLTGSIVKASSLSGSLTKLIDGSDYLKAGSYIQLTTGSNGDVTIAVTGIETEITLQNAYDNSSDPATITTTAGKELLFSLDGSGHFQVAGPGAVRFGTNGFAGIGGFTVEDTGGIVLSTTVSGPNAIHLQTATGGGIKLSSNSTGLNANDGEIVLEAQNSVFIGANDNITIQSNNVDPGDANILIQAIGPQLDANQIKVYTEGTTDITLLLESKGGVTTNAVNGHILAPHGTGTGQTTSLKFRELAANGDNYVAFKAADSIASNVTWTLPTIDGASGQFLSTNGAGSLSWLSTPEMYFFSTTIGSIYTTGSVAFRGAESSVDSPGDKGADVWFYVSGSSTQKALFGGDLVTSSSLRVDGNAIFGNATSDTITFNGKVNTSILPSGDLAYNLGSTTERWANIYTGDLHLRNDRGDWTVIEEEEYLSLRNNKTGKMYKFVLEEVK